MLHSGTWKITEDVHSVDSSYLIINRKLVSWSHDMAGCPLLCSSGCLRCFLCILSMSVRLGEIGIELGHAMCASVLVWLNLYIPPLCSIPEQDNSTFMSLTSQSCFFTQIGEWNHRILRSHWKAHLKVLLTSALWSFAIAIPPGHHFVCWFCKQI